MCKKEVSLYSYKNNNDAGYDYIEPEVVYTYHKKNYNNFKLIDKIRFKLGKLFLIIILPISFVLIIVGGLISTSVVGSIIGIPLVALGIVLIVSLFFIIKIIIPK